MEGATNEIKSGDNLDKIFETIKWEQSLLYPMIQLYEQKEAGFFKIAITITSLYLTAVGAIFVQSYKVNPDTFLISPYDIVFAAITLALCLLNVVLIKFIASNRAGCILTMRQINCLRRAIDSMNYYQLYKKCPPKLDDLLSPNETNKGYWLLIGRHRKLPITNDHFRYQNMSFITKLSQSPDGFLIVTIIIFSLTTFFVPVGYILLSDIDYPKWVIFCFAAIILLFISSIWYVIKSSINKLDDAINLQTTVETNSECEICNRN